MAGTSNTHRQTAGHNLPGRVTETIWRYYDRTSYKLFRRVEGGEQNGAIEFLGEGPHALSNQHRVPVLDLEASDTCWLMNKAAQLQLEHFNKSNALGWAITMGLFAMPVIYSERDWNQIVGESYFIQLAPGDSFGWAEPDGKVHQIAAAHLETLKEEIYRVCYLSQASGEDEGGHAQSALSKQLDFQVDARGAARLRRLGQGHDAKSFRSNCSGSARRRPSEHYRYGRIGHQRFRQ